MDSRRIKTALVVVFSVFAVTTLLALAQPTATNLYVEDADGYRNTTISVPVNIMNTQNGVAGIEFELVYNKSVLNLTQVRKGDLFDDSSSMLDKKGEEGDYTILVTGYSLTDGSNGSIVVCDFNITGEPGETSLVNLSNINLYNKMGETGTASANNGTFTVLTPLAPNITSFVPLSPVEDIVGSRRVFNLSVNQTVNVSWRINGTEVQTNTSVTESSYTNTSAVIGTWNVSAIVNNINGTDIQTWMWYVPIDIYGSISSTITYTCNEIGIAGVTVNLTQNGTSIDSTVTDSGGNYTFTDVSSGDYSVSVSKIRFWSNSTSATVNAGETTIVSLMFWLKGDLNNNGYIADIGDLVLMKRACLGEITGDWKYNLNNNGYIADIGDLVLMKRAKLGDIELL